MKVMCIKKDTWLDLDNSPSETKDPVFGEICEVIQSTPLLGTIFYSLLNYEPKYNSIQFVRLSNIDETELAKEREELQTV